MIEADGGFGGGPPPVARCEFLCSLKTRFAVDVKFFILVLHEVALRWAYPRALTVEDILSHTKAFPALVTLLDWGAERKSLCLAHVSCNTRSSFNVKLEERCRGGF